MEHKIFGLGSSSFEPQLPSIRYHTIEHAHNKKKKNASFWGHKISDPWYWVGVQRTNVFIFCDLQTKFFTNGNNFCFFIITCITLSDKSLHIYHIILTTLRLWEIIKPQYFIDHKKKSMKNLALILLKTFLNQPEFFYCWRLRSFVAPNNCPICKA